MPLTWFAHQVPALGAKLGRPRRVEATAMCVGSMVPDLAYSFSAYLHTDHHRWPAAYALGVPIALAITMATRRVVAPVVMPEVADGGAFRLRSYAVIATRRPPLQATILSIVVGIWSHIALDWFTHPRRPGPRLLGYDDVSVTLWGHTEPMAGVLQLIGHVVGTIVGVALLWHIGRARLLDRWYGADTVAAARARSPRRWARRWLAAGTVGGVAGGLVWGWSGERVEQIQRLFVGTCVGVLVAALAVRQADRRAVRSAHDARADRDVLRPDVPSG